MVTGKKVNKDLVSAGVCAVLSDVLFVTSWTGARQTPLSLGILQARNLKWVAMPSSRRRDQTQVSGITGGFFTIWARREALLESSCRLMLSRVLKHNSHHKSWPHLDTRKQLFMPSQKLVGYYQTRIRLLSFSWWQFPGEQDGWVLLRSRHAGSQWHMRWSIQRDLGRASTVLMASTVPWHHILLLTLPKKVLREEKCEMSVRYSFYTRCWDRSPWEDDPRRDPKVTDHQHGHFCFCVTQMFVTCYFHVRLWLIYNISARRMGIFVCYLHFFSP